MVQSELIAAIQSTLMMVLLLSGPALATAIVVGFMIGLFQAVTQIQDQGLPMAVKIVTILAVCALTGRAFNGLLIEHTGHLMDQMAVIGRSVVR
jgi:type III secretion protein S